jgi:hypothetical protein
MAKSLEAMLNEARVRGHDRLREQRRAMEQEMDRQKRQERMYELLKRLVIEPMLDQSRAARIAALPFVLPLPPRGQA